MTEEKIQQLLDVARVARASLEGCLWCSAYFRAQKKGDKTAPCPNVYHLHLKDALKGIDL